MQENIKQVIVKNTVRKEFKTAPIWQWDTGHVLVFEGFDLPEAFQVHFAFSESGESVPQIGSNDQVTVPDALVEDGRTIYAWLYISTEDSGLTKFVILMPVNRRAKPTHQVPPPVEQSEIDQAIAALNTGVARAETAADNAETAEENASQYADNAYNSSEAAASAAESAEGDARTATQKAQEASESAQLASQKASEASGYADNAQGSAQNASDFAQSAQEYAQTAGQKATEATRSAENAVQKAQEAASHASDAEGSASDAETAKQAAETARDGAQGYAGNAAIMAQEATQSKNTAVQKAGEASQSATAAAQSARETAQTATQFAADITQLKSDIESKQDAPSVAGTEGQVLSLDANGNPVWANVQTESEIDDSTTAEDSTWSSEKIAEALQDKADVIISSASGAIASFPDGAAAPVEKLVVNVEPKQDLHGYDHPWPAGGGANQFNPTAWVAIGRNSRFYSVSADETITVLQDDGSSIADRLMDIEPNVQYAFLSTFSYAIRIFSSNSETIVQSASGTFTSPADGKIAIKFYANSYPTEGKFILVKGNTVPTSWTPYENICPITGWTGANVARTGKNLVNISIENGGATVTKVLEVPIVCPCFVSFKKSADYAESEDVWRICGTLKDGTKKYGFATERSINIWGEISESNPLISVETRSTRITAGSITAQLERGSTASDFEDYKGTILSIEFPSSAGIVYGGSLTVNEDGSGVLTVDRASVDLGTLTDSGDTGWKYVTNDGTPYFRVYLTVKRPGLNMICSAYETSQTTGTSSLTDKKIGASANDSRVYLRDSAYTDLNTFISAMSGVQLVYELATPITYTLTASQVTTLLGTNHVWSDAGDVSIEYRADTKLYIDNKLAELVAQIVNS